MSRTTKWLIIAILIALILFLFRMKAITPASILSAVLALAAISQRLLGWWFTYRQFKAARTAGERAKSGGGSMTLEQARDILGVKEGASKDEINAAYKRLMQKLHPDKGGNAYLASQINEARDMLLKRTKG